MSDDAKGRMISKCSFYLAKGIAVTEAYDLATITKIVLEEPFTAPENGYEHVRVRKATDSEQKQLGVAERNRR